MRHAYIFTLLFTLAGCQVGVAGLPAGANDITQDEALAALEEETGATWMVRYHEDIHTPAFLEGRTLPMVAHPSDAAAAARAFLAQHRALFRLLAPAEELHADPAVTDELGMTHVRLKQRQGGVAVYGAELVAHFDAEGALVRIHGRYQPLPELDLIPRISSASAKSSALAAVRTGLKDAGTLSASQLSLVIDPWPAPRLTWLAEVNSHDADAPVRWEVFIDAMTGEVYRSASLIDDLKGSGRGVLGNLQELEISERSGQFYLEDGSGGAAQKTYSTSSGTHLPGTQVHSSKLDHWDETGLAAGAAVDAHAYTTSTMRHFVKQHGRQGAADDGKGMRVVVHYGKSFSNAFWDGREIVFGDGDGLSLAPFAAALDVVAHEFTHAVVEAAAELGRSDEPGALGESLADVFACWIEQEVRGARANWTIGEDLILDGGKPLRDLARPRRLGYPEHLSERVVTLADHGGVHANSSIPSHAAYLAAVGGQESVSGVTVRGIGNFATERIWYRALVRYLGPWSGFSDLADATLAAARDLYGARSNELATVQDAWRAVGVID